MRVRYTGPTTPYLDFNKVYDAISEDHHSYAIVVPKSDQVEVFLKRNFVQEPGVTEQAVYDKYLNQLSDQASRACCRLKRC